MTEDVRIRESNDLYGSTEIKKNGHGGEKEKDIREDRSCWRSVFPRGIKDDAKIIAKLTWPLTVSQLTLITLGPIGVIMAGHIGITELAAVSLAISVLNVTGISVMFGLSAACDTLFSNAYGSGDKKLVGVYLQKSMYILPIFCLPCWALHVNSEAILVLLGQDPAVSKLTAQYLLTFCPGLFFCSVHQVLFKYLISQNIVMPNVVIGLIGNATNLVLQYLFVFIFELGVIGCAAGQAAAYFTLFLGTLLYIIVFKKYKETWGGFTWRSLEEWGIFIKLAIAGFIMMAMEWWQFEFGIFMSGILGTLYLSSNALVFNLENLFYCIPMSFSITVGVRVGQLLGAGDAEGAKNVSRVGQCIALFGFVLEAVVILSLMEYLPYIFTNQKDVAKLVTSMLPLLVVVLGLDAFTTVTAGILRGCGRQRIGAISMAVGCFAVGLPLSAMFMFLWNYGTYGFWYGLIIGLATMCCVCILIQANINWDNEVERAKSRLAMEDSVTTSMRRVEDTMTKNPISSRYKWCLLTKRLLFLSSFVVVFAASLIGRFTVITQPIMTWNVSQVTNSTQ